MRTLLCLTLFASLLFAGSAEDLKKKLDALDKEIAAQKEADKTALGADRLEELRVSREKMAIEYRRLQKAKTGPVKPTGPSGIEKLFARAATGDVAAQAQLQQLRTRINAALAPKPQMNGMVFGGGMQGRNVFIRANGAVQVIGLGGARVAAVPTSVIKKPAIKKPAAGKSAAPSPKKKPPTEKELVEQEVRAKALEKQLVEMTRKVLELEQRLTELRAKVAEADKR
jgi:hypothetical protein